MDLSRKKRTLSLIIVEAGKAGKGKDAGRYIIENRMDATD
jgi:hypothetical protein